MPFQPIIIRNREVEIHPSINSPEFASPNIIVEEPWDYVARWLKIKKQGEALFYWEQARDFYKASSVLHDTASPLTSYYCTLNATKSLLTAASRPFANKHGVSGRATGKRVLTSELVQFQKHGVLTALCKYLDEPVVPTPPATSEEYNMFDLFRRIPFLHRSFMLNYRTPKSELFIRLVRPRFVKDANTNQAWFCAELESDYVGLDITPDLPTAFERDNTVAASYVIKTVATFVWNSDSDAASIQALVDFHQTVRQDILPIYGFPNAWYLRKRVNHDLPRKSFIPMIFGAMHRLSELSRYNPQALSAHLDNQHGWLIREFLRVAPSQYTHQVACEITGNRFVKPYLERLP